MFTAVFIVRHGIMCGVQEVLGDFRFREELLHGEPVIKEIDGVMPGSRFEEREYRQVVFRISGGEYIQVIAKIPAFLVGIPADVTVGLSVDTVAAAVPDSLFETAAGTFFTLLCSSVGGAIPGEGKVGKSDQSVLYRAFKEQPFKNIIKPFTGSHILWRMELFYGVLLHRQSLFSFPIRLSRLAASFV